MVTMAAKVSELYLALMIGCVICHVTTSTTLPSLNFTYHDHLALTEYLHQVAESHPFYTKLYTIGQSTRKKDLWVLEVTGRNRDRLGIPNVKLVGNIHGNEAVGREVILHLIQFYCSIIHENAIGDNANDRWLGCNMAEIEYPSCHLSPNQGSLYLVENYPSDPDVQWLLDNSILHFLPSMNPDGFEVAEKHCGGGSGRKNYNGVDLNRNFPDYYIINTIPPQSERTAVIGWLKSIHFVLSASLHGGALLANYPFDTTNENTWDTALKIMESREVQVQDMKEIWSQIDPGDRQEYDPSITPDDDVFRFLATKYAATHPTMHRGEPCELMPRSFKDGITNGAAWYPFPGGMQDYNYVAHGCLELTLEIGCCKYPPHTDLPKYWEDNKQALLQFLGQAQRGVHGVIRDNTTRQGIPGASLRIEGRDMPFSANGRGEFWRILLPGNYKLSIHKHDYEPKTVPFTVAKLPPEARLNATWLDIYLIPVPPRSLTSRLTPPPSVVFLSSEETSTPMLSPNTNATTEATLQQGRHSVINLTATADQHVSETALLNVGPNTGAIRTMTYVVALVCVFVNFCL